jgi:3-oxoacyl-[acyl-carrier-protein] synthase II
VPKIKPVITNFDLITAYGQGIQPLWDGLISGRSAISRVGRFSVETFLSKSAAFIDALSYQQDGSLVMQALKPLIKRGQAFVPADAFLILATTVGEIDLLEKDVLANRNHRAKTKPVELLEKVGKFFKLKNPGVFLSCACASSSTAIAQGASLIRQGKEDCVLIVAADSVNEFVFSGFSSLMALDKDKARPFDKNRSGLSLGEAAGFILMMSKKRAEKEKRCILGEVLGWGLSCDANHMTGPSRDGAGLSRALLKALSSSGVSASDIDFISAHGTGTLYNDAMELKAFKQVFKDSPKPLYSIKGGVGHTLGCAGLAETLVALKALDENLIPATVGLEDIDPEAIGWADTESRSIKGNIAIVNNCGFGGINAVLVLKSGMADK